MTDEAEQQLANTIEVIDLEPTVEEVVQKTQLDAKEVKANLNWLSNQKTKLEADVRQLSELRDSAERDLKEFSDKVQKELSTGQTVTKKVAALEVYKQTKMTNNVLIGLVLLFVSLLAWAPLKPTMGIPIFLFLALFGWHFMMNQRKLNSLKGKYHL